MRENRFKVQTSASEIGASNFRGSEGDFLVEFLDRDATVSSEHVCGRESS
jgi:hypothetical protein